ncbi:symmetrical bis(5'-nucleosyl)-tetraphosphatase [Petrachloros mirabilis]
MATYAIGDVQGCFISLTRLLDRIAFNRNEDRLWLVGDLVNRGPRSLTTLRFIKELGNSACVVLGNHDLFLLAVSEGIVQLRPKDTIKDILAAKDRSALLDWLRRQPLHHREGSYLMVHAGLLPQWTIKDAAGYAHEVEIALAGPDYRMFLRQLFHGPGSHWTPSLEGWSRLVSVTQVLTRIRTCQPTGEMSNFSGPPEEAPAGFTPWFRVPNRRSIDATIITGHWAALGLQLGSNHLAIDSGCVWGRQLTAVRLEDRKVFQVDYSD